MTEDFYCTCGRYDTHGQEVNDVRRDDDSIVCGYCGGVVYDPNCTEVCMRCGSISRVEGGSHTTDCCHECYTVEERARFLDLLEY